MDVFNWRNEVYNNIEELKEIMPLTDLHLYWIDKKNPLKARKQSNHKTFRKVNLSADDERKLVNMAAQQKQIIFIKNMQLFKQTWPEIELTFNAKSALYIPIMNSDRKVLVVMENVVQYIQEFAKWFAIWLSQRCKCNEEARRANFHDVLLSYLLEHVNKSSSYENFLNRFLKNSKEHLQADKYYFYDYDIDTNFSDFYEEIDGKLTKTATRLKFFKIGSFCDQVRDKRKPLIVEIDDSCEQLDREIKQDPKAPLRYIIFSPLIFGDRYLGIIAFANTEAGDKICKFSEDEVLDAFRITSLLANALAFKFIVEEMERQTARIEILRETLINLLHARLRDQFDINTTVNLPPNIDQITWELENINDPNQLTYVYKMFHAVYHFDPERLKHFLLCVQIAHNNLPYSNIRTAFHMTRTVYCAITKLDTRIKPFEKAALMIAMVGYSCCQNGLDNRTMVKLGNPLTLIHKTYMRENHRIWIIDLLIAQSRLLEDNDEADEILSTITLVIMNERKYVSDIFRSKIEKMLDTDTFNLALETHTVYALAVILRIGVFGRHLHAFNVAKDLRDDFYDEVMALGDYAKANGINIADYQDSNLRHDMFKFEVKHLRKRVIPTLDIMLRIFPETISFEPMPRDTLKAYEILVNIADKKLWDPKLCLKTKKKH